ncbi:PREDICTED: protein IQ-DOMAIN 1-like [Camelina sativa]|uniref:Protein IQ-DOMAIN 1-like n=1 Tax=Camelina sativa TaxID=90675 RepID=A0ABM0W255_CAMSA|nr:PREDICTED: protein IQ-DOMAIN 1-like [Camelina sativa]XP_010464625.1 PREDICTED: protein IQ-DOMAIN 1-like [Camelina sativa]XP_010464627.1 PREDICTED: protein IQ-DOMAIN 1-like [Camelina sativa]
MVKKAKWLKNVKKAFSPDSKKLKHESVECQNSVISYPVLIATSRSTSPQFEVRVDEVNYDHKKKKNLCPPPSDSVTVTVADVPVDSPPSSPESFHQAIVDDRFAGMSKEEASAILIQTTFRGYLARRELQALKGRDRLKLLMEGSVVHRQAANTLKCMQTLTRVQSQIRSRRIRMSEENQARHKQLLQKHGKELGGTKNGGNWNDSNQSKAQVEAGMLHKHEATMRRERALAYAFTHQQNLKSNSRTANPMFMDPSNPTWGWSWLERWMAGQPWESSEKEQNNKENSSVKNSTKSHSHVGETAKSSNRNKLNRPTHPNTSSSSSTTTTKTPRKKRPVPPSSIKSMSSDEDTKSSEKNRRHSIARSSVSDDENLASSTTKRSSNMVPTTKSARGKVKPQTSSRVAVTVPATEGINKVLPEKAPAKKRLSNSASPAPKPRRSSAPPKVENNSLKAERTP